MQITAIIQNISRRLAQESNFSSDASRDEEVFSYAIIILLLNATALGVIMLLAWLLGTLQVTLFIWTAFFSLRIFAGGRHQSGPVTCWITTVIAFTALGYLIKAIAPQLTPYAYYLIGAGLVFALYAVILYAPVTIASKRFSREKRLKLKNASVVTLFFWTSILLAPIPAINVESGLVPGIMAGLIMQAFSILPLKFRRNERNTC